jgi:hypothetical protein
MYGMWWYKPFSSQRAIPLLYRDQDKEDLVKSTLELRTDHLRAPERDFKSGIDMIADSKSRFSVTVIVCFNGTAIAFPVIHVVACNWDFPSPAIKTLWRTFSLLATSAPLAIIIIAPLFN